MPALAYNLGLHTGWRFLLLVSYGSRLQVLFSNHVIIDIFVQLIACNPHFSHRSREKKKMCERLGTRTRQLESPEKKKKRKNQMTPASFYKTFRHKDN